MRLTGLYYYGARYYNPRTSIWLSVDPLAREMPQWSPYNFVFNNPLRFVDPLGLAPDDWVKKGDQWMWDENITSAEQATAAGYDDYRAPGSIIDNATINGESRNIWTRSFWTRYSLCKWSYTSNK